MSLELIMFNYVLLKASIRSMLYYVENRRLGVHFYVIFRCWKGANAPISVRPIGSRQDIKIQKESYSRSGYPKQESSEEAWRGDGGGQATVTQ